MSFSANKLGNRVSNLGSKTETPSDAPRIYSERYKHSLVDSQYNPSQNLLTMVSGTPKLVEYYRGVYNEAEEPIAFQPSDISTYQSYTRIKGLIIKDEGDGSYSYDPTTGESSKTYSAFIGFDVTPIIGDALIADIGDGNAGLFSVIEQPEILNFTADKVYRIQYQLLCILTEEYFNMLDERVVEELVYNKDSVLNGGNALIDTGTYATQKDLLAFREPIATFILSNYYWNSERTIAVKNYVDSEQVENFTYDPYLVEFLTAMITPDLRGGYRYIGQLNTQHGAKEFGNRGVINIWEVFKTCNFHLLSQCTNKATLIDTQKLFNSRTYGNIRNSKFDYLLVTDPDNYDSVTPNKWVEGFPTLNYGPDREIDYFLSEEFFAGNPQGEFEEILVDTLKNNIFDRKRILEYCKGYWNLTYKEKVYHGALLLYIIELSRRINTGI